MASGKALLPKRLKEVLRQWPADPTRKGRDLGEFLVETYRQRFQKELDFNAGKAREAVESLEKLAANHYRNKYKRETDYSFCEEKIPHNVLSNENLEDLKKRTIWDRIMRR